VYDTIWLDDGVMTLLC